MGDNSRQKRILADLSSALRRDPNIDEFDFIPCPEPVVNRSPVVLENHKLGLATWSIKLLFSYVYNNLMQRTGTVKDLKSLHEFSCAALLLNPECYAIWNMRKELVTRHFLKAENDLKLATLIQTKHPKSPETFIQRRWLLQQLFPSAKTTSAAVTASHRTPGTVANSNAQQDAHSNGTSVHGPSSGRANNALEMTERHRQAVQYEMEACRAAADRYPSNYNAWSHRIWVLQKIARLDCSILEHELESTKMWVRQHISDHSGFSYRHFLLQSLTSIDPPEDMVVRLLREELVFTASLIQSFPGHEAIWYHRRAIINTGRTFLKISPGHSHNTSMEHNGSNVDSIGGQATNGYSGGCNMQDAAEPLPQQENGEWLQLQDYSSLSGLPHPQTGDAQSPEDTECQSHNGAGDEMAGFSLEVLLSSQCEEVFMETVYKKTYQSDRPLQQRCIHHHKRWLHLMQY